MLAYQQQHRQPGSVASSGANRQHNTVSGVPPASTNAATSNLRFGNGGITSWAVGSNPSSGSSSNHSKHFRLNGGNDSQALRSSQQGSRGTRRFKPTFNAPHWQKHHGHQAQQRHDAATGTEHGSRVHPLRRVPNAGDINKQWRASPASGLTVNTSKTGARETTPFISSTFQNKDSPLLSGLSLALNKHKVVQPDGKPTTPLYEVPLPRTPHPLSPADSMKTPGYVDPESLPFELGSTITDPNTGTDFKLLSVLGEGSYAVVYLARSSHDGAKYALKCLSKLGLTPRQLSLQRTELDIHTSVCPHPHIVTLYSHFETRDWLFLVMERVAGPDLYDYITQHPAFNANQEERRFVEATRLFEQMIDAVAHIHALKAYHRDLKPENFILGADGNIKLTDFGLATRESLSEDFECGSKPYMSYENRNGGLNPNDPTLYGPREDYSPRLSDVWALGVLFLNLLFAQSPWTDPSRGSCFKFCRFLREGAGFLVSQFPKLPREVADFLVTRVFSPESGRCNVLELKQWVRDLGYPFNPPRHSAATSTAPRPINLRHKNGSVRKTNGSVAASATRNTSGGGSYGSSHNTGSLNKKWLQTNGSLGASKAQQPVALTALTLDSAAAAANHKPKSPVTWRAPAPHPAKMARIGATPHYQQQASNANNLSTSVPALVFSQIIPATQAAAARKMMPRELNPTAAKAAAAILQSSMLCLPKNGLGQGKKDNSEGDNGDDVNANGASSWNQLESLSEAEEEDDDGCLSHTEYSAAATDMASKFPKQSIAGSLGCSLSRSFMLDSEDDMDFSEPLSFEDLRRPHQMQTIVEAGAKSLPSGGIPPIARKQRAPYADSLAVMGHFSDDDSAESQPGNTRSAESSQHTNQASLSANRVRFTNARPSPPAVVPLSRGGNSSLTVNSADSSLTATLVSPSVEYFSPHMQPQSTPAHTSDSTDVSGSNDIDADDEADDRAPASARKAMSAQRNLRFGIHADRFKDAPTQPIAMHSMPAPFKPMGAYSLAPNAAANTTFSWADDVEELPIPNLVSRMSMASVNADENSDGDDALSDEMSWSAGENYQIGHSDDMFDMEL
ncbi:hypothetical protein IWW56_000466 [Coemansia sp. RSA 2131]|nr:hypothetical protein IWW56_000466 [Coemansia sp. RSA 2131]